MGRAAKLKVLRRLAEQGTVGMPDTLYGHVRRTKHVMTKDGPVKVTRGQRVLASQCTRRAYKDLKRANPGLRRGAK